jgi:hypothetical protein
MTTQESDDAKKKKKKEGETKLEDLSVTSEKSVFELVDEEKQ